MYRNLFILCCLSLGLQVRGQVPAEVTKTNNQYQDGQQKLQGGQQKLQGGQQKLQGGQQKLQGGQQKLQGGQQQLQNIGNKRSGTFSHGTELKSNRPTDMDDKSATESSLSGIKLPFGLPSWDPPELDMSLDPIFGNQFSSEIKGSDRIYSGDIELGLSGEFQNIPVLPGTFLSVHGGGAGGGHSDFTVSSDVDPNNDYQPVTTVRPNKRTYVGGAVEYFMDSLRFKLGIEEGVFTKEAIPKRDIDKRILFSLAKSTHLGVRLPGKFALWQSYRDYRAYYNDYHKPRVKEIDYYLHTKFKIEAINLDFDMGLGISDVRIWQIEDGVRSLAGKGISRTLRSTTNWQITEDWLFEMYLRYAYSADEGLQDAYDSIRLPTQELAKPIIINGTPKDTLNFWLFTGMQEVIEDLTLGFAYSWTVLNYGKKDAVSLRQAGPIVEYAYAF